MWLLINKFLNIFEAKLFNELELKIFKELISNSEPNLATLITNQLKDINKVTRDPDGLETLFYHIYKGKPSRNPNYAINDYQEYLYATLTLFDHTGGKNLKVKVWTVEGYIFEFQYNENYNLFLKGVNNWDLVSINIRINRS